MKTIRKQVIGGAIIGLLLCPSVAFAAWVASGTGASSARAVTLNAGNAPSGSQSGGSVTLSWSASTLSSGQPATGYIIKRYDSSGTLLQAISLGSCSTMVSGTTCSDTSVADGIFRYSVTPTHNNWRGAESAKSTVVVDLTPPPIPSITANPTNPSSSPNASFSFTDTEQGVSFQCQIDGGGFGSCTSAKTYSALVTGSHTFGVRAVDAAGNASAAATYTWTINPCAAVSMASGNNFTPNAVTIALGCSVRWTNTTNTTHDTTSNPAGLWASGPMAKDATFTRQFTSAGTFNYRCTIHAAMTGTVTVNP